ncbi:MAG: DNA primase [Raoultibacter sp.]
MALISEEDVRLVRDASDLVAVVGERVPLRQRGRDFWLCCPFHKEKTPSCKIDPGNQLWHCFGCGEGGDVFSFVMKLDEVSFPDAVRALANRANIQLQEDSGKPQVPQSYKARLKEICKQAALFYHGQLMRSTTPLADRARTYLAGRSLGGSVPKTWQLGFAPGGDVLARYLRGLGFSNKEMVDANVVVNTSKRGIQDRFYNRIMFPIFDAQGDCIAFGGRVLDKHEPKYLNSQETPIFHKSEVLFGLDKAKVSLASTGIAVVVEGYTDVICLHEAGITNVVATMGTALTMRHIRTLSHHAKNSIIYLFDGDEAGQRAADRALSFIDSSLTPEAGRSKVELAAVTLPKNIDPADFVTQYGAQALQTLLDDAQPLLKFGIERRLARFDLTTAEGRNHAIAEALAILAPIKDSLLAKDYAVQVASRCRAREEDVLDQLAQVKVPSSFNEANGEDDLAHAPLVSPLSPSEKSRRRFEREFLSLCACHASLGQSSAAALASTQWHVKLHGVLAQVVLAILAETPSVSAAECITRAAGIEPKAADVLSSGTMTQEVAPEKLALFLAEELAIGDLEESVASLHDQLKNPERMSAQDYEVVFESVVALQKDLTQRRLAHKPLTGARG